MRMTRMVHISSDEVRQLRQCLQYIPVSENKNDVLLNALGKSKQDFSNLLGLFFASLMALFFGLAQVYSRQLKNLDTSLLNASVGIFGFSILLIASYFIEGNTLLNVKKSQW